jgi:hypothetical protein
MLFFSKAGNNKRKTYFSALLISSAEFFHKADVVDFVGGKNRKRLCEYIKED